jgi:membrane associated rhomboid family serine protease
MSQFNFNQPFSGVVRHLIIINVLMFFGTLSVMGEQGRMILAAFLPGSYFFAWYQVITHMFMHGSFSHLLFNMLSLYFFAPMVEMVWGPQRFLFYYLSCGLGSYALFMGLKWVELQNMGIDPITSDAPMLGASGAIFGVYVAFAHLFPNQNVSLLFPPITLNVRYLVLILAAMDLYQGLGFAGATGVAHFAHLGGAFMGFLTILMWNGFRLK